MSAHRGSIPIWLANQERPAEWDIIKDSLEEEKMDNLILLYTLILSRMSNKPVVLVTQDIAMRLKADALGIQSEGYKNQQVEDIYSHAKQNTLINLEEFMTDEDMESMDEIYESCFDEEVMQEDFGLRSGEMMAFYSYTDPERLIPSYFHDGEFFAPNYNGHKVFGIRAKNGEQKLALSALMDEDFSCVSLLGKAGTGKTLLALAAGLEQVVEKKRYTKLIIARPIIPMGKDLGFLPGSLREKMDAWLAPIYDSLEILLPLSSKRQGDASPLKMMEDRGQIEIQALTYIRGRSISNAFILIDEAQSLTPHELKTVLTRVGEGSKIVFTGDPGQIDVPYMDESSCGLAHLAKQFTGERMYASVSLQIGERSALAEAAARKL